MKKIITFLLTLGITLPLLACGNQNSSSESDASAENSAAPETEVETEAEEQPVQAESGDNEIVFWSMMGGSDGELIDSMIEEYNALDTGYTVKHYIQDWGEYYNKLTFSVLSGEAPDVGISHVTRLMQLADQGVIKPLDDVAGSNVISWDNFINDVDEKAKVNGTAYAVPFDFHGFLLYYNTDLLVQAGILGSADEELKIGSFEEYLSILQKVKELDVNNNDSKDDDVYPMALQVDGDVPYKVWYTFYLQNGGTPLLSEDGSQLTMDDSAAEKGIEALLILYNNGYAGVFNNQWEDFKAGKAAFIINLTSDLFAFDNALEGKMGVIPMPAFFDNSKSFTDSHSFIVPIKESRSAEKEKAVMDFVNWMVNSGKWMETGHFPTTKTVFESEEYNALPYVQNYKDAVNDLTYMSSSKNTWLLFPPKTLQNFESIYADRENITAKDAAALIREGLDTDK